LCHFQLIFGLQKNLNPDSKLKYKAFLMNVAKDWATEMMEAAETESDTGLVRPGLSTPCMSRVDPLGEFCVICGNMSSQKL
jgi:hypothetical protein